MGVMRHSGGTRLTGGGGTRLTAGGTRLAAGRTALGLGSSRFGAGESQLVCLLLSHRLVDVFVRLRFPKAAAQQQAHDDRGHDCRDRTDHNPEEQYLPSGTLSRPAMEMAASPGMTNT